MSNSNRETLAAGGVGSVERCTCCGEVTLHLGAVSLRLEPPAFAAVCELLVRARQGHLPAEAASPKPTQTPGAA